MMKRVWSVLLVLVATCSGVSAQAVMITTGGDPASGTAFLTIDDPIEFTIRTGSFSTTLINFIINEAVPTSDGSRTAAAVSGLSFTINGGTPVAIHTWEDNLNASAENVTPKDSFFYYNAGGSFNLQSGDIITLLPGTLTFTGGVNNFNMFSTGDYTMWIASNNGTRRSYDGVAVPEPGCLALLGMGAVAMWGRRRR